MKIYIIEKDKDKFKYLVPYFDDLEDVILINADFKTFMDNNFVECVVSPANSYGDMSGGYDLAVRNYFGKELQEKVQEYIKNKYNGEQPVGTSFIIEINDSQKLIHTPTMKIPSKIQDEKIIYYCMKETLLTAKQNNVKDILIPMFGGLTGGVSPENIAIMMRIAYNQVKNPLQNIEDQYIRKIKV